MKKLVLAAPCDGVDSVIKKLISLRCIAIDEFSQKESAGLLNKKSYDCEINAKSTRVDDIQSVIVALSKYTKTRISLGDGRKKRDRDEFVSSGDYDTACSVFEKAHSAISALDAQKDGQEDNEKTNALVGEISALACHLDDLCMLYDIEKTNLEVIKVKEKAAYSDTCAFILGWMPKKAQERVEIALSEFLCAYEITDPDEDDEPPVRVSNNFVTRCFEWITSGFGTPKYYSFDPTLIMSIFCFFGFGLMIHDVGYGLILSFLGLAGSRLVGMRGKSKKIFNMLGVCGFSSMIFGVLLGGWFGNMPYAIMQNFLGIENAAEVMPFFDGVWFKAARNPIFYLALCLGLGAIQIIVRMIVRLVLLCREGRVMDAVLDIIPWFVVFAGIAVVFAINLVAGLVTIGVGALMILAFHGREKKGFLARLGGGALGIGKILIYVIGLANYLKIFVVGISIGILTHYVNLLSTLAGNTTWGYVLFAVVSVIGHGICLVFAAISSVAFVKSIQHSEFFKHIDVCGGGEFVALEPCEEYTLDVCRKVKVEAV